MIEGTTSIYELPDGSRVELTATQSAQMLSIMQGYHDPFGRGQDQQTCLLNFQKYGKFKPTAEDFAAYRARRDALPTSPQLEDIQTGYANASIPFLYERIFALARDKGSEVDRKVVEELRRRLAIDPAHQGMTATARHREIDRLNEEVEKANAELQKSRIATNTAWGQTRELQKAHAALSAEIRDLERRVAHAKGELPEDVTAGGRKLAL